MKKIFYLSLLQLIILISCNIYLNDCIGILVFNEDLNGNDITNDTLEFILIKRSDTNSLNKLTYISGSIFNKKGNRFVKNIEEAMYIDINNTNTVKYLNTNDYKIMIDYTKEKIVFTDNDDKKYTLPLNNSEDTWFYKLLENNTNL